MHDKAWFLTAEQREAMSLRLMVAGRIAGPLQRLDAAGAPRRQADDAAAV